MSLNSPSGLIVHEGAAVYSVFLRWRAVNLHWDVQSYNKAKDMEEASAGHSSLAPRTLWLPLVSFGPNGSLQATQLGSESWTRLCLASFCPRLLPGTNTGQENESGEVVIRVTSVWGDTWCSRCVLFLVDCGILHLFFLILAIFPLAVVESVFSGAGPQTEQTDFYSPKNFFLKQILFYLFSFFGQNFEVRWHKWMLEV